MYDHHDIKQQQQQKTPTTIKPNDSQSDLRLQNNSIHVRSMFEKGVE